MTITESFNPSDRYKFDFVFCTTEKGYAQVDSSQDAHYFGTWANPFKREIVNYCEGDVTVKTAETDGEFLDELLAIKKWNEGSGFEMTGIDPGFNNELRDKFVKIGARGLLH